ncbi:MAG: trypsin-like peptidase domain-containing protein [Burkholderiales bacterium]|nr:trypsin-like peptidase domain-containing protein [Burkholderiales bacterium]
MTPVPASASFSSPSVPEAVARVAASVVGVGARRRSASGLAWRDGVVVTTASAVWRASQASLVLPDGEQVSGEVRGIDASTDLAAIAVAAGSLPLPQRADADAAPRVGEFVFAVGREPSGLVQASFGHIGSVAGEWRTWRGGRVDRFVRLDGGLYPGLDGAPVADGDARVLGVASSGLSRHHGIVLPASTIDRVLDQLLAHGRVRQGYLGVAVQPVRALLEGTAVEGLLVSSVADEGPAAAGGLRVSDVIVTIDGQPVSSPEALRDHLQVAAPVRLVVSRGGQRHELAVDVAERPGARCG